MPNSLESDGFKLDQWQKEFIIKQEPLGEEFEKVLFDNRWELYD